MFLLTGAIVNDDNGEPDEVTLKDTATVAVRALEGQASSFWLILVKSVATQRPSGGQPPAPVTYWLPYLFSPADWPSDQQYTWSVSPTASDVASGFAGRGYQTRVFHFDSSRLVYSGEIEEIPVTPPCLT